MDNLVQNAPHRHEYNYILKKLEPILYDLPPKIVIIDGRCGTGKTTLGRFLAWRFNISLLETDLYLIRNKEKFLYRNQHIKEVINSRLLSNRPIIVEGVVALAILQKIEMKHDFHINVTCEEADGSSITQYQWEKYSAEFSPLTKADLIINLPII